MLHVFISYSRHDRAYAKRLSEKLREQGFTVWMDVESMRYSDKWWDSIVKAISACAAFVVIVSPASIASIWVQREILLAEDIGKKIFPVLLKGTDWGLVKPYHGCEVKNARMPPPEYFIDLARYAPRSNVVGQDITDKIPIIRDHPPAILARLQLELQSPPSPEPPTDPVVETDETVGSRLAFFDLKRIPFYDKLKENINFILIILTITLIVMGILVFQLFYRLYGQRIAVNATETAVAQIIATESITHLIENSTQPPSPSATTSVMPSITATLTLTATDTVTGTKTPVPTATPTSTFTATWTPTFTETWTSTPTFTSTFTPTVTVPSPTPIPAETLAVMGIAQNTDWTAYPQMIDQVEMVLVPAGCFKMGFVSNDFDETCVSPFWLDRYEISNRQFADFGGTATMTIPQANPETPRVRITWIEARNFCAKRGMRLPTEAEWEYAVRGPDRWLYPWGTNADDIDSYIVHYGNSDAQPNEIGSKPAGMAWVGAFDMYGNVREWVSTIYYDNAINPYSAQYENDTDTSHSRVIRGGSWNTRSVEFPMTERNVLTPTSFDETTGFRCARNYVE